MHDHLLAQHAALKTLRKIEIWGLQQRIPRRPQLPNVLAIFPLSPRCASGRTSCRNCPATAASRLLREYHRLLSVRAEANSPVIAQAIIPVTLQRWTTPECDSLFGRWRNGFRRAAGGARGGAGVCQCADPTTLATLSRPLPSRRESCSAASTARQAARRRSSFAPPVACKRLRERPGGRSSKPISCICCRHGSIPGFLEMRRVGWSLPAHLLEQIIRHEAVHAIDSWDDLRRVCNRTAAASRSFTRNCPRRR